MAAAGVPAPAPARKVVGTPPPPESEDEIRPVRSSPRVAVPHAPARARGGGATTTGGPPAATGPATPRTPALSSAPPTTPATASVDGADTPAAEPDDLFLPSASPSDVGEDGDDMDDGAPDDGSGGDGDDNDGSLFGLLLRRPAAMSSVAAEWHERISEDGPGSVARVLTLVARSSVPLAAGAPVAVAVVSPAAVVADAPADTTVELTAALAGAFAVSGGAGGAAVLPFSRRTAQARRFALAYTTFFSRLVTTAPDEVLYDIDAFDTLLAWLVALSGSHLRPLRQAATAAAYAVLDGVLELRAALRATTAALQTSLAAASRSRASAASDGGGGGVSSSSSVAAGRAAVADDMRRKVARAGVKDKDLASLGDHVWRGIVQSSYRDVAAPVRVATVEALARWAVAYPSVYLSDERLKYLGWLLNDPAPAVRGASIGALSRLFSDPALAGSLDMFASRFGARIVEMGLDVDAGVAEAALQLAAVVRRLGLGPAAGDGGQLRLGGGAPPTRPRRRRATTSPPWSTASPCRPRQWACAARRARTLLPSLMPTPQRGRPTGPARARRRPAYGRVVAATQPPPPRLGSGRRLRAPPGVARRRRRRPTMATVAAEAAAAATPTTFGSSSCRCWPPTRRVRFGRRGCSTRCGQSCRPSAAGQRT